MPMTFRIAPAVAAALLLLVAPLSALAQGGDRLSRHYGYGLAPAEIAPGVYVFWGLQEAMSRDNGASIVNTGFIVGDDAVLAVDTGPTRIYAEEMLAAIGGNWLVRTTVATPTRVTNRVETIDLGNREVRVIPFENGHTPGDLAVWDEATGTLFAGDLVFVGRTPTVPHAHIPTWLAQIDEIRDLPWQRLVPGHGPLVTDRDQMHEMEDYLRFLDDHVASAVDRGDTLADSLAEPPPERFRSLAEIQIEYQRALLKLFRDAERQALDSSLR